METRSRKSRALVGLICCVVASTLPRAPVGAQDPLPPDDGAPPEEYERSTDLRTAAVTAAAELPATPPTDNAFPISGATRSSCSDSFGDPRSGGRTHMGVDCFAALGTPLVAVESGTIRYAMPGEPYSCSTGGDISGNRVSLRGHSGYVYYYGHLDAILVATEQPVEEGQVIGTVGNTGNAACTRAHLHFEVKCSDGDPFDPYPWMASWGRPSPPPPGPPSTARQGAGVTFSGPGRQDLFTLACGSAMLQRTWYSSIGLGSAWNPVEGFADSDPDAASPGAGANPQIYVTGPDRAVYQLNWTGSSWAGLNLGGICTSGPTAAYADGNPDHLDMFCRGTDQAIWQRSWDSGVGWSGWNRVGGIITSDPDAASPGPDFQADVFVRGYDNAVYQLYLSEQGWASINLGGICTSGPSAAYSGPDRLDVFCRGNDLALYHRSWRSATGWSPGWARIESRLLSDPEAVSLGQGRLPQVFVRGMDRRLYQFQLHGSGWVSWIWGVT